MNNSTIVDSFKLLGAVACMAAFSVLNACSSAAGEEGTETHWLKKCVANDECGVGQCLCGVCSVSCTASTECPAEAAVCVTAPASAPSAGCFTPPLSGLCAVSGAEPVVAGMPDVPAMGSAGDEPLVAPTEVNIGVTSSALTEIQSKVETAQTWTADALLATYPTNFESTLGFDPLSAINYDLIQASALALTPAEEAVFQQNGFVISEGPRGPTFSYGYHQVYGEDLPVYVTADSVLDALHRSYDDVLKALELELLIPALEEYLSGVRAAAATRTDLPEDVRRDVDFFFAVPQSLLSQQNVAAGVADGYTPTELAEFVDGIGAAAAGTGKKQLFGFDREIDFTQFKPRGHYTDTEELSRYFKAMMWLGRVDFRLIETLGDGSRVLHRRQVEAMLALKSLMAEPGLMKAWKRIDSVVSAFVGEHDYMTVTQAEALEGALGITQLSELAAVPDDALAQAIVDGQFGEQRIASHIIRKEDMFAPTLPLNASFAVFGQRYVVDSHVFSNVVWDRTEAVRYLPDPLDVAFAALGNNHAGELLRDEINTFSYAGNLGPMRVLVDEQPESSWSSSLYTLWLGALRELSAGVEPAGVDAAVDTELPSVFKTESWGRRLLNAQLGSWAQLRHDTLLYAKQSYTAGDACEYPDAYVDPYPEFWAQLLLLAERGGELLVGLEIEDSAIVTRATDYFARFSDIVAVLHGMSLQQRSGLALDAEQLAFINNAIRISDAGSGPPTIEGWYHQLLFNPFGFSDVDVTIADVHTYPGGNALPQVLHVGTGFPRLMTVAVETCDGPRAYVGPVYSYKEYVPDGLVRLDDEEWQQLLFTAPPGDVPWMAPLVVTADQ